MCLYVVTDCPLRLCACLSDHQMLKHIFESMIPEWSRFFCMSDCCMFMVFVSGNWGRAKPDTGVWRILGVPGCFSAVFMFVDGWCSMAYGSDQWPGCDVMRPHLAGAGRRPSDTDRCLYPPGGTASCVTNSLIPFCTPHKIHNLGILLWSPYASFSPWKPLFFFVSASFTSSHHKS